MISYAITKLFPSWEEFREKAKKFEEYIDKKRREVRHDIQAFKDKHQTVDEIITTGVKFLPSPYMA
jgi:fructoselysine-6-P-deglycase FrlB-like protein